MRNFICLSLLFIAFPAFVSNAAAQTEKRMPIIVELFTSEGCSSCPRAEANLQKLLQEQPVAGAEIIALSEHVDYWNRLGWIDRFSSEKFSIRQAYYTVFFKQPEVYTPQMVVDGTREFIGGRLPDGIKQITEALKNPKGELNLEIEKERKNIVSLRLKISSLPEIARGDKGEVFLAVTEDNLISNITRGENRGRTLTHAAVARSLKSIGNARKEKTLTADIALEKDWKRENLSVVAFVQEHDSRRIIGAAKISL
jgi:hypothetical protein